jgi:hypothetical protein
VPTDYLTRTLVGYLTVDYLAIGESRGREGEKRSSDNQKTGGFGHGLDAPWLAME